MVGENAWNNFNFFKFTKAWSMAQDVVYPGECSMCTWEECIFCSFGMECSINISLVSLVKSVNSCVPYLIFCLDDLSIDVSGLLKSLIIMILLSISPFMAVSSCLIFCSAPMLGAYIFTIVISSSWIDPFWLLCSVLLCLLRFSLKSVLSDKSIATPAFLWFPLACHVFFHPLTFGLCSSPDLKWVSCKWHVYGSGFCIHSTSLCLSVGAFNPFTFSVIMP